MIFIQHFVKRAADGERLYATKLKRQVDLPLIVIPSGAEESLSGSPFGMCRDESERTTPLLRSGRFLGRLGMTVWGRPGRIRARRVTPMVLPRLSGEKGVR
jgi:hypothetical protein